MTCKPTVGEVRECKCGCGWRLRIAPNEMKSGGGRIVEVAPENRARVTAGPEWMR